jgi:hypothetical protein
LARPAWSFEHSERRIGLATRALPDRSLHRRGQYVIENSIKKTTRGA